MSRWFDAPLTSLAFCWRLARADGVTLGLTSHDQPLTLRGLIYAAAPGMVPSAIERRAGLGADSVDLSGALTSGLLSEADLAMGRWDGARLTLYAVNWCAPDEDPMLLLSGQLGSVDLVDGQFTVELAGRAQPLNRPATFSTSPLCRAQFGGPQCGIDMAGRVRMAHVIALAGTRLTLDTALATDAYQLGRLRWAEGPQAGQSVCILTNEGTSVTLADAPRPVPACPLLVEMTQGCDRRFSTCQTRFANAENFRGEPHLPGTDVLMRYGG